MPVPRCNLLAPLVGEANQVTRGECCPHHAVGLLLKRHARNAAQCDVVGQDGHVRGNV